MIINFYVETKHHQSTFAHNFADAFYYVLGNVEPQYRSVLKSIQLISLCPTRHIKKYGVDAVLRRFMCDLHLLESVSEFGMTFLIQCCQ